MSEIEKLAAALAKAQGQFPPVPKTGRNPHLGNAYATLDDIIGAVRAPLSENGLSVVQLLNSVDGAITLRTLLLHESGQSLEGTVAVTASGGTSAINALQQLGAAITYMKRYSLSAMLGIAADTDGDGEGARATQKPPPPRAKQAKPKVEAPRADPDDKHSEAGINSPKALFDAVNNEIPYFDSIPHMLNTIRKVRNDPSFAWPGPGNTAEYLQVFGELVDYASAAVHGQKSGEGKK